MKIHFSSRSLSHFLSFLSPVNWFVDLLFNAPLSHLGRSGDRTQTGKNGGRPPSLSLSDRFVSKRVDDLGIVKRAAKYNERTRRFDGSRIGNRFNKRRLIENEVFIFSYFSFYPCLEYEYLVWFRFKA